ncbi:MAG TPA: hypothetical protein PLW81_00770 [Thiobacillaceae bacterium]|nr:hypothetical protein [Thiobacillaceae bacterium]
MSCITVVGGGVAVLLRVARQGRPILALDGRPLHSVLACLPATGPHAVAGITLRASRRHTRLEWSDIPPRLNSGSRAWKWSWMHGSYPAAVSGLNPLSFRRSS